jgi:hypothetical protein
MSTRPAEKIEELLLDFIRAAPFLPAINASHLRAVYAPSPGSRAEFPRGAKRPDIGARVFRSDHRAGASLPNPDAPRGHVACNATANMRAILAVGSLWLLACTGTIVDPGAGGGGGGDDDDDIVAPPDATPPAPDAAPVILPHATGIRIRDVALYQAVKVPLVDDGTALSDRNAPIVEGAGAMIGVFVDLDADWQAREVVGELAIEVAPGDVRVYTVPRTIAAASESDPFESGFAFVVDGADITAHARVAVTLREATESASYPGSSDGARFPAAETDMLDLDAVSSNGPLELVLVPFQYNADGSGRMPPVDDEAVERYRKLFLAMYPVAEVNVTVREPVPYNSSIGSGSGWSSWLDRLTAIRDNDDPPPNAYYYGIASPRSTFSAYCSGGCIIGLGWVPGRDDEYGRASVGVTFADSLGIYTSMHEVGHTMGRSHTPCGGPSGVDWSFPYSGGGVGVWGYDAVEQKLKSPSTYTDIMGYCNQQWISDYTYNGIHSRVSYVNQLAPAANTGGLFRVGLVDAAGDVTWTRTDSIQSSVGGDQIAVALLDEDGAEIGATTGRFYGYDHLPGGMLLVPVPDGDAPHAVRPDGMKSIAW